MACTKHDNTTSTKTYCTTKSPEVNKSTFYQENIWKCIDYSVNGTQEHENTTTANHSLQHKATWGQCSYVLSRKYLKIFKV
jgi:hypothetical protein